MGEQIEDGTRIGQAADVQNTNAIEQRRVCASHRPHEEWFSREDEQALRNVLGQHSQILVRGVGFANELDVI